MEEEERVLGSRRKFTEQEIEDCVVRELMRERRDSDEEVYTETVE